MTSPAEPASTEATPATQLTRPLREPVALVLLGATALLLFVGLVRLLVPQVDTVTGRAWGAFGSFVGVDTIVLPVLAVLLATHIRPVVPKAKLITQVALAEYAAAAGLGLLCFLIALVGLLAEGRGGDALVFLLQSVALLALLAAAAFPVYRIWRTLYFVPKPKPQPGVYGQPQPGWPQQQGWPAPGGQPQQGPYAGQPGAYGYPANPGPGSGYGTPPVNPAPGPGTPYGSPRSAPPSTPAAPPFGPPPSVEPTQTIPRQPSDPGPGGGTDRTQRFDRGDDQPR